MISEDEHLIRLSVICVPSLQNVYSNNLPIFIWLGIVLFGFQSFYLLYVQILYHIYNWQMFSHSLWFIIFYSLNTVF